MGGKCGCHVPNNSCIKLNSANREIKKNKIKKNCCWRWVLSNFNIRGGDNITCFFIPLVCRSCHCLACSYSHHLCHFPYHLCSESERIKTSLAMQEGACTGNPGKFEGLERCAHEYEDNGAKKSNRPLLITSITRYHPWDITRWCTTFEFGKYASK